MTDAPRPADVQRLLREAAQATTLEDQQRLVAQANATQAHLTALHQASMDVDLARAVIVDHLTPVAVHERHTASTDWLATLDTTGGDGVEREMIAQATLWYGRTAGIRPWPDEFAEQARGEAHKLAGAFGTQAPAAEQAFLTHTATLYGRELRAGMFALADQGSAGPATQNGLPLAQTSSERAPGMQAMEHEAPGIHDAVMPNHAEADNNRTAAYNPATYEDAGTGGIYPPPPGTENPHGTHHPEHNPRDNPAWPEEWEAPHHAVHKRSEWWHDKDEQELSVDPNNPNSAWNRWGNSPHWKDHQEGFEHGYATENRARPHDRTTGPGQAYHEGYDLGAHHYRNDLDRPHDFSAFSNQMGRMLLGSREEASMQYTATCPSCLGHGRVPVRVEAASGLPQVQEIVDANNQPHAETPPPWDVAFPWEMQDNGSQQAIGEAEKQIADREKLKGASRQQRAVEAYHRVLAGQDDSGWLGDMGAGGVGPGEQDGGNPGPPTNLGQPDPVYGYGGDQGDRQLKPYGADEANDETNNMGMNWQPGQPTQYDTGARPNVVGQPTASRIENDPEVQKALAFVRQRKAFLASQYR